MSEAIVAMTVEEMLVKAGGKVGDAGYGTLKGFRLRWIFGDLEIALDKDFKSWKESRVSIHEIPQDQVSFDALISGL